MLHTIHNLLNNYLENIGRFDIDAIFMERGDNPEDIYYLCRFKNTWYLLYETDYIGSLAAVTREATEILERHHLSPLYWVAKKDVHDMPHHITLESIPEDKIGRSALILKAPVGYMRYALLHCRPVESGSPVSESGN